jgi:hypothetical protein
MLRRQVRGLYGAELLLPGYCPVFAAVYLSLSLAFFVNFFFSVFLLRLCVSSLHPPVSICLFVPVVAVSVLADRANLEALVPPGQMSKDEEKIDRLALACHRTLCVQDVLLFLFGSNHMSTSVVHFCTFRSSDPVFSPCFFLFLLPL